MKIALLGSVPKGDQIRENWHDWRKDYTKLFLEHIPQSEFLSGDDISDKAGAEMVVGHDLSLIKRADICVVDGRNKIGAGTSQEILVAKYSLCRSSLSYLRNLTTARGASSFMA